MQSIASSLSKNSQILDKMHDRLAASQKNDRDAAPAQVQNKRQKQGQGDATQELVATNPKLQEDWKLKEGESSWKVFIGKQKPNWGSGTSSSVSRSVKKLASKTKKKLFGKSGSSKASVASSSMGGSSKGSFNFFKKSSKNMSSAPAEIQVESAVPMKFSKETALPQMETEKEEEDLLPPPPPPVVKEEAPSVKVVEPTTADEPVSQNRGIVYQDDNTGKKDDQLCGGNCVVM